LLEEWPVREAVFDCILSAALPYYTIKKGNTMESKDLKNQITAQGVTDFHPHVNVSLWPNMPPQTSRQVGLLREADGV
jgi:LysM repeat protein